MLGIALKMCVNVDESTLLGVEHFCQFNVAALVGVARPTQERYVELSGYTSFMSKVRPFVASVIRFYDGLQLRPPSISFFV